jgi:predicted DNA-binding transcriptional regulator AlpA
MIAAAEQYISANEAAARLGINRRTFFRQVAAGTIPPPAQRFSRKLVRWLWSEIVAAGQVGAGRKARPA